MPDNLPFPVPNQPASPTQQVSDVVQVKKSSSKFGIFIGFLVVITLVIYGGVGYLYLGNKQIEQKKAAKVTTVTPQPTVNPDTFSPDQIQIMNGSIYRNKANGDKVLLVNKEGYKTSTGIIGFAHVKVSPDNNKMCFESWSPAPKPALYYSNIDGTNVTQVSLSKSSCSWSSDSKDIIYVNTPTGSQAQDIFIYKLDSAAETDLTSGTSGAGAKRNYTITGLSSDGTEILCSYEEFSATSSAKTKTSGNCQVNISSGEIINL